APRVGLLPGGPRFAKNDRRPVRVDAGGTFEKGDGREWRIIRLVAVEAGEIGAVHGVRFPVAPAAGRAPTGRRETVCQRRRGKSGPSDPIPTRSASASAAGCSRPGARPST